MPRPRFVTLTGVDTRTDLDELIALSRAYPSEWAILISPTNTGNRFISIDEISPILEKLSTNNVRVAIHVCGGYARMVNQSGFVSNLWKIANKISRVQVNTISPNLDNIVGFAEFNQIEPIVQYRTTVMPDDERVCWLYDKSGGKGIVAQTWPNLMDKRFSGIAGGIGPDNVRDILEQIHAYDDSFYIDMETSLRSKDWFDLNKCRQVLETVYEGKTVVSGTN